MAHKAIGPYLPGPNDTPENGIYCGDYLALAEAIPASSIGLILSDPVYDQFEQYKHLAQIANRVLQQERALLAFYGIGWTRQTLNAAYEGGRETTWICGEYQPGPRRGSGKHFAHWHALAWFEGKPLRTFADMMQTFNDYGKGFSVKGKGNHEWRKPIGPAKKFIEAFSNPGDVVFDPFCGHGGLLEAAILTGRRYIGFEIDPKRAQTARDRLRRVEYQPPIKIPKLKQVSIFDMIDAMEAA